MSYPPGTQEQYPSFHLTDTGKSATRHQPEEWKYKLSRAWDAYNGRYPAALKTMVGAPNDNVSLNLCRTIVDTSVAFLFGKSVAWNLDKEETRSPDEEYLDKTWALSNKDVLLNRLGTNGGIFGQPFLKIRAAKPYAKLSVLDPTKVSVDTAYDDYSDVNRYVVRWEATDSRTKKKRAYRQVVQRVPESYLFTEDGTVLKTSTHWTITDQQADERYDKEVIDEGSWVTIGSEVWAWPFAPIVECQNLPSPNDYWGISDIEPDVIALNEAANRSLSNIGKILRNHAFPKTYTIGLDDNQQKRVVMDPTGVLHLPGDPTTVKIDTLEMNSDLASSINFYERLREAAAELSQTPPVATGKVQDVQYLSAMAMQILYGPMMSKTNIKRMTYGDLIVETNRRLLAIAGRGDDKICDLNWPDTFPRDAQLEALTAQTKLAVGFSKDTMVASLGGDPKYERERRKADMEETVEQEGALADATQPPPAPGRPPTQK